MPGTDLSGEQSVSKELLFTAFGSIQDSEKRNALANRILGDSSLGGVSGRDNSTVFDINKAKPRELLIHIKAFFLEERIINPSLNSLLGEIVNSTTSEDRRASFNDKIVVTSDQIVKSTTPEDQGEDQKNQPEKTPTLEPILGMEVDQVISEQEVYEGFYRIWKGNKEKIQAQNLGLEGFENAINSFDTIMKDKGISTLDKINLLKYANGCLSSFPPKINNWISMVTLMGKLVKKFNKLKLKANENSECPFIKFINKDIDVKLVPTRPRVNPASYQVFPFSRITPIQNSYEKIPIEADLSKLLESEKK